MSIQSSNIVRSLLKGYSRLSVVPLFNIHSSGVKCHKVDTRTTEERRKHIDKYRYVPSKYRVAISAYQKATLDKMAENSTGVWSDGSKSHPLPQDPTVDYPLPLPDGGLQYYGFEYYPPDFGDLESLSQEEISPLFMVRRVKHLTGVQWYIKDILENLGIGLEKELSEVAIVKNLPEMNAILYVVKHFVDITPIKIPKDLPLDADPLHCFLSDDGVFTHDPSRAIPKEKLQEDPEMLAKRLDKDTIRAQCKSNFYHAWDLVP